MYIRKSIRFYNGRSYVNYVLVESVHTAKGPRQKTICSLGDLGPRSRAEWLKLAGRIEDALVGQGDLLDVADAEVADIVRRVTTRRLRRGPDQQQRGRPSTPSSSSSQRAIIGALIKVDPTQVSTERHREAGPVHVGYWFWQRLDLDRILGDCGLSATVRRLACAMVLNRLIAPCSEHAMPSGAPPSATCSARTSTPLRKTRFMRCSTNSIRIARPSRRRWLRASAACSISMPRSISTISPRPFRRPVGII